MATTKKKSATKRTRTAPPARKSAGAPKSTARKASGKTNGFHAGLYTVPRGHVSIAVPPFWTLRQTNDDLELDAPSGGTSIIVNAYQRNHEVKSLDARVYLHDFLERLQTKGRPKMQGGTRQHASVHYRDTDGNNWELLFLANGDTLLMATCSTTGPMTSKEARLGLEVMHSLKLKAKK
ncbi:MAG TPA: hypothetical protein VN622_06560 [Clostridia bacterium]|nr:hypothetical protein [Clostridia bacterium]